MNILQVSPQKTAPILSKLLKSAVANAEQGGVSDVDQLFVKQLWLIRARYLSGLCPVLRVVPVEFVSLPATLLWFWM